MSSAKCVSLLYILSAVVVVVLARFIKCCSKEEKNSNILAGQKNMFRVLKMVMVKRRNFQN